MKNRKEQEEAIEFLEFYKKHCLRQELKNLGNYETVNDEEFVSYNIETALNMLKEKDKEKKKKDEIINELLKENVKLQKELNEENNRCMILANNDKFKEQLIDLMAEWIEKHSKYYDEDGCYCELDKDICKKKIECENCIKQYFERKAEE